MGSGPGRDAPVGPHRAQSLTPKQRGKDVTTPDAPLPVHAWIQTIHGDDVEVDALAIAWTKRAVQIRYVDKWGRDDTAWVWAGAVSRV